MFKKILVANWKMYLNYQQSCNWLDAHAQELINVCQHSSVMFILCPSTLAIHCANEHFFKSTNVFVGAQEVSAFVKGAYTGQISAQSLAQGGVRYCLVNHHEHKVYLDQTQQDAAQKIHLLLEAGITPIVLIGEKKPDDDWQLLLQQQIKLFTNLALSQAPSMIFAYEPAWSIGTGSILKPQQLQERIDFIRNKTANQYPVLYGGSVTIDTVNTLLPLSIDGFLLGAISTDFQMLKKIVNLI